MSIRTSGLTDYTVRKNVKCVKLLRSASILNGIPFEAEKLCSTSSSNKYPYGTWNKYPYGVRETPLYFELKRIFVQQDLVCFWINLHENELQIFLTLVKRNSWKFWFFKIFKDFVFAVSVLILIRLLRRPFSQYEMSLTHSCLHLSHRNRISCCIFLDQKTKKKPLWPST